MGYFRELPNLEYQSFLDDRSSSDQYLNVKNLFRRIKLRDDIQNIITVFDKYTIKDNSRPDTVAEELYGRADLDWVILLCAGIINVRNEWPLSDNDLYRVSLEKYGDDLTNIHHYETIEVYDNSSGTMPVGTVNGAIRKITITSNGAYYYPPIITPNSAGNNAILITTAGAFTQTANLQTAIFSYIPKSVYTENGDEIETEDGITLTTD